MNSRIFLPHKLCIFYAYDFISYCYTEMYIWKQTQRNRRHPFHTYSNQNILFPFPPMSQCHNSAWPLTQPASKIHPCHYSVSGMGTLKQQMTNIQTLMQVTPWSSASSNSTSVPKAERLPVNIPTLKVDKVFKCDTVAKLILKKWKFGKKILCTYEYHISAVATL